ncbi:MAG: 3'(2'),5'-bisphosphate nucleotidase CysQ [Hyphomicrobiales bacterium]
MPASEAGTSAIDPARLAEDARLVAEAVADAGRVALDYYEKGARSWTKGNQSPVTEADIAVDDLLRERLTRARPDYGWLSEETADTPERLQRRRLFVVDPIDGTRAFVERVPQWTISVAVVEDGLPVVAALLNPSTGTLFTAETGTGTKRDGAPVRASGRAEFSGARLAGPKKFIAAPRLQLVGAINVPWIYSLALRFAMVAAGDLDGAFARPGAHDWDLAAADLLVHEAGGHLTTLAGERPRYNAPEPRHDVLVAAGGRLHSQLLQRVADGLPTKE